MRPTHVFRAVAFILSAVAIYGAVHRLRSEVRTLGARVDAAVQDSYCGGYVDGLGRTVPAPTRHLRRVE